MKKPIFFLCSLLLLLVATESKSQIIPTPNSVILKRGAIKIGDKLSVSCSDTTLLKYLDSQFSLRFGIELVESNKATLNISSSAEAPFSTEGYNLTVTSRKIHITSSSATGSFYGVQSLIQLINVSRTIKAQVIDDSPRFIWRSLMFDEARYFHGENEVKRLLDVMSELKMNVLHWHLTDDSGWRVEIKKYPYLTLVGGTRKDSEIETWLSGKTAGKPHSGFYTQDQIKEIVKYAKVRHIKIVPEIEMPGHASAAVAAYPHLGSNDDIIEVPIKFGKHYAIFNLINPAVEQFLKDVVDEVIPLFETDIVHIGGDEVRFNQWESNPEIAQYKKDKGFSSFMDIQIEFTNKFSHYIESKGAVMMGWNEILGNKLHGEISFDDPSEKVADNVVVQFWKGNNKELLDAAKGGYKLVNSNHVDTYLDYTYKSIPLKRAYHFDPIPSGLPAEYHKNIVGSGAQMWTEWTPETSDLHSQIFPRLAAYAEVGWTEPTKKNYVEFLVNLDTIVERWAQMGIKPADKTKW